MLARPRSCRARACLSQLASLRSSSRVPRAQSLKKMMLVQMHPIMGIGEEVFLYAVPKRLGYFAAEGLDVDIQNSQTGMISAQVLQSNNAQVGTTAAAAVMTVREQGADIVSFFNLKRNAGTFLVVLKDLPIRKLEDLKGKTIGAPSFGAGGGLGAQAEPERDRHRARAVYRDCNRRRAFGHCGAAHRSDRRAGDVGFHARRSREHGVGAARRQHPARGAYAERSTTEHRHGRLLQHLGGGQPARQSLRRGDRLPDAVHGVRQGQQEAERLVVPPGVARAGADGAVGHSLKDRPRRAGPLPVTRGGTRRRDRPRVRAGPSRACPVSGQTPA